MPAKASDLERVAKKLGFQKTRQKGSHARWKHPDGRATTIPIHSELGGWLSYEILKSKNPVAQVNELLAKIIAYNLTVVIHEMYENGIQPEFLHLKSEGCN